MGCVMSSFRHGPYRDLCDGTGPAAHDACAFIQRRKLTVQIAPDSLYGMESHLLMRETSRSLTEGGDIRHDDEDMPMPCSNARYSAAVSATFGVIRRSTTGHLPGIQEQPTWSETPLSSNGPAEEFCDIIFDAHRGKGLCAEFFSSELSPRDACCTIWAASWS